MAWFYAADWPTFAPPLTDERTYADLLTDETAIAAVEGLSIGEASD